MKTFHAVAAALILELMTMASPTGLTAAELKVLAGGSMTAALNEIKPQFERASGHKLDISFAGTPDLIKQATSGAPFDCGVVPVDVMKNVDARAKFASAPPIDIARVGFGVAVKAGAPKPTRAMSIGGALANLARASAFFITSTGTTPQSNGAPDVACLIRSGVPAKEMSSLCPDARSNCGLISFSAAVIEPPARTFSSAAVSPVGEAIVINSRMNAAATA